LLALMDLDVLMQTEVPEVTFDGIPCTLCLTC
jgi:hypothetical protein